MRPTRVWLIRHGRIAARWRGRFYGDRDVPLAPEGHADLERAAAVLAGERLDAVVSSALARTDAGAELLAAPRALAVRRLPALREIARGEWVGLTPRALQKRTPGAFDAWLRAPGQTRPPGGESLADVAARAWPVLAALAAEHRGASVAIVSHCWTIRALLCAVMGLDYDCAPRLDVAPGSLQLVEWTAPSAAPPRVRGLALDRAPVDA
jgi:broad specificity phosphatase PhoE